MNRDDIIRMAREAGFDVDKKDGAYEAFEDNGYYIQTDRVIKFAALVTAAKDAEHQQTLALQQRSYEREIQLEVEAEREACAKVCDDKAKQTFSSQGQVWGYYFARVIRARSNG